MEPATVFDLPDEGLHIANICEERIIAGGIMPYLHHSTYQGTQLAKVPVSSSSVFSVVYNNKQPKMLSVAGSSNKIDICTNFNYREMVVKFM